MIPYHPHGATEIFPDTLEKPASFASSLLRWKLADLALQIPMPGLDLCQVARFGLLIQARRFDKALSCLAQIASAMQIPLKFLLANLDVKLGDFGITKKPLNRHP